MSDTEQPTVEQPADATAALAPAGIEADVERALTTGDRGAAVIEQELTPEEQQRAIVERILRSQTLDEILASFEATPIDNVLDQPFEIQRVRWERSDYEEGNPFYCLIDATMIDTGEQVTLTTGATNVLAQLLAMSKRGYLPAKVVCRQSSKPTKSGYFPKHLEAAR